jgi:ATP-dependent Clp protease ATP-binding subunit ClpA
MQLANQEAQRFNYEYIGTEHILLGLIKEGSGVASVTLRNLNISRDRIREEVEKLTESPWRFMEESPEQLPNKLPQTPRAKKVIEYSMEEAKNLKHRYVGHRYVGTEHILLGLLREQEGVAAQILMNLGLNLEDVRDEVLRLLGVEEGERNIAEMNVSELEKMIEVVVKKIMNDKDDDDSVWDFDDENDEATKETLEEDDIDEATFNYSRTAKNIGTVKFENTEGVKLFSVIEVEQAFRAGSKWQKKREKQNG